ncbi:MAG: LicD family protein [Erysipelotrichaceae bacterium]|nr:LicD family protein [Erysipelotrichaceae bacterium]
MITHRESQEIMLGILEYFDDYCNRKGLRYTLAYGTLLGAIRHKGFIPWDNDIDVYMPRPDYEQFIKDFQADAEGTHYRLLHYSLDDKFPYIISRIVDTRTVVTPTYLREIPDNLGLWIDIFVVDGLWERPWLHPVYWSRLQFGRWMQRTIAYYDPRKKTFNNKIKRVLLALFPNDGNCRMRNADKVAASCRYDEHAKGIDVVAWAWKSYKQYLTHEDFDEPVMVEFEGHQFRAPKNWDRYLKNQYGDYMKLPPEEDRKVHDFHAEWKSADHD